MKPFDLQVNGYAGVDFCSDTLSAEQIHFACEALKKDGVSGVLATLITDRLDRLCRKLKNWRDLREQDPLVKELVLGFHLEGPFLTPEAGFIGAHPPSLVCPPDVDSCMHLLEAGGGMVKLLTLAPELDEDCEVVSRLVNEGVVVSAGHCNPSLDQLTKSIDHGLGMVTHFGNGCPPVLDRHDNILQRFLSLRDQLWFCFIADGNHMPFHVLSNYLSLVGVERSIMVTDAISAASMSPGAYELSGLEVMVDDQGVTSRKGVSGLAGSTLTNSRLVENLKTDLRFSSQSIEKLMDLNPRKALGIS